MSTGNQALDPVLESLDSCDRAAKTSLQYLGLLEREPDIPAVDADPDRR
ncbi:MAG: hypothetical protein ACYCST_02380 [Acidimicrobiales bacterium]